MSIEIIMFIIRLPFPSNIPPSFSCCFPLPGQSTIGPVIRKTNLYMKRNFILLALLSILPGAYGQEKLPNELALQYASILTNYTKELRATPIPTHPDFTKPVGVRSEGFGGMVLPETGLKAETLSKAGKEVAAVGQLWMVNIAPIDGDNVVPTSKLHMVHIVRGETEVDAACCALGVQKSGSGLELLIYGKSTTPLLRLPMKPASTSQGAPIDITAERTGDSGLVTLSIAGKFQASFKVTASEGN
jgi:hypothetical protein